MPQVSVKAFVGGLAQPFKGMVFLLANRGLKRYAVLPLVVNVLLYGLAFVVFAHFLWNWNIYEVSWEFLGPVGRWLSAVVNWLGWLIKLALYMVALGAAFFTFTTVGMTLASPLNDILSEKVENVRLGGAERLSLPFRFTTRAALLSLGDSLWNVARQLFFTALTLPCLLVPVVGFVPLFLVGGYFAGFGYIDTAMARNFLRPRHKKLMTGPGFWRLVGFGAAMQVLFAIPLLGLVLMPVGVASGTLLYCDEDWESLFREAGLEPPAGFVPPKTAGRIAAGV